MTWLFAVLVFLVVVGTALALVGRWRPTGLAAGRPAAEPIDDHARFEVVLRGYRMDQVDAELGRLRRALAQYESAPEVPDLPPDTRIDP